MDANQPLQIIVITVLFEIPLYYHTTSIYACFGNLICFQSLCLISSRFVGSWMSVAVVNEHIEQNGITVYFFFIIHSRFCLTGDRIFELTNTFCKTYLFHSLAESTKSLSLSLSGSCDQEKNINPFFVPMWPDDWVTSVILQLCTWPTSSRDVYFIWNSVISFFTQQSRFWQKALQFWFWH